MKTSLETTWTKEQIEHLVDACKRCGITPPTADKYILDTVYSALQKLTELIEKSNMG